MAVSLACMGRAGGKLEFAGGRGSSRTGISDRAVFDDPVPRPENCPGGPAR